MAMTPRTTSGGLADKLRENRVKVIGGAAALVFLVALFAVPMLGDDDDQVVEFADDQEALDDDFARELDAETDFDDLTDPLELEEGLDEATTPEDADGAPGEAPPLDAGTAPTRAPRGGADPGPGEAPSDATQPPAPGGPDPGNTRGVSNDEILIGVAIPDIGAFTAVDPAFDIGDMREQMEAVLDGWRRSGAVPVHGRDVRFVYRDFDILSSEEKIAACRGLIEDDGVFAVIGGRFFGDGAECVTERFKTPLITVNSAFAADYERGAPFYFTMRTEFQRLLLNWTNWAHSSGLLEGKVIGLMYEDDWEDAIDVGVRQELARLGYEIEEEVAISSMGQVGTTQAPVAVQRFRAAGVDFIFPVIGGTAFINFTVQAESQQYRPDYVITETGDLTTDAGMSPIPDGQAHGTFAMTQTRTGEIAAGVTLPRATQECVANYERYSGKDIGFRSPETAEYDNIRQSCDLGSIMLRGLQNAGPALGHMTLVRGWQAVTRMSLAGHADSSFSETPYGVGFQRTIRWSAQCSCWTARTGFSRWFR